jgi:histidyl-tRNA synthetase
MHRSWWPEGADPSKPLELGGGGRYDKLIDELAGRPTPAAGYAMGVERVALKLKELGRSAPEPPAPQVFLAQLGDRARKRSLKLLRELESAGITVAAALSKDGIKPQLEAANRLRSPFALIIGQKELMDGTVILRDMENGIQEIVDAGRAVDVLGKRLAAARAKRELPAEPNPAPNEGPATAKA